jgi:hypothetical protein
MFVADYVLFDDDVVEGAGAAPPIARDAHVAR